MESYSPEKIPALIAELDGPYDEDHQSIAVGDESGWTISAYRDGLVVWENVEEQFDVGPRHIEDVPVEELERLMHMIADGNVQQIEELDWQPGYG